MNTMLNTWRGDQPEQVTTGESGQTQKPKPESKLKTRTELKKT